MQSLITYRDADETLVIVDLALLGERVAIGRRPGNDVVLDWDSEVSRVHAVLERLADYWTVVDDGLSRNGSYVNGERITRRRRLHDGDVLTVGGVALAFWMPGGASGPRTTATALGPHVAALLTGAQRRVLTALCRPYNDTSYAAPASNRQIADELVLSIDTVKGTLSALFELFGLEALPQNQKRTSLARQALRTGAITRRAR